MTIVVRRIEATDGALARDLRLRALADAPEAFGSTLAAEADHPPTFWDQRAARQAVGAQDSCFLAFVDGRAVGLVAVFRRSGEAPSRAAELVSMWVSPETRAQGIGSKLVDAAVEWARTSAAETIELWVTVANEAAVALYRRKGFVEDGEYGNVPYERSVAGARMVRRLDVMVEHG